MIRAGYEIKDIQLNLVRLFQALKTAGIPISHFSIVEGYPNKEHFTIASPLLYIEEPIHAGDERRIHGGTCGDQWNVTIGLWDEQETGGINLIGQAMAYIRNLIKNRKTLNEITYNINYYGTAYTATNLSAQGIGVRRLQNDRWIDRDDTNNAFRFEFELVLIT